MIHSADRISSQHPLKVPAWINQGLQTIYAKISKCYETICKKLTPFNKGPNREITVYPNFDGCKIETVETIQKAVKQATMRRITNKAQAAMRGITEEVSAPPKKFILPPAANACPLRRKAVLRFLANENLLPTKI
jgi:hypothetical protein